MKNSRLILLAALTLAIYSCKKNASGTPISGDWKVVSDSTYSSGIGPNATPSGATYIGTSGDHFNFTTQGKLYAKIGDRLLDTATYSVSGNKLTLNHQYLMSGGVLISGAVSYYTVSIIPNRLTLTSNGITPGGIFYESIVLSK